MISMLIYYKGSEFIVIFLMIVNPAVNLDNKFSLKTIEIGNKMSFNTICFKFNQMLTAELLI